MREIQYFLDLNGIKQIYISKGIIDNKDTILKEINYENYFYG